MEKPIDLTKCDTYENGVVPNADVELCLKVIRTIRNCCLDPHDFDANGAIILSHAHAKIVDLSDVGCKKDEPKAN